MANSSKGNLLQTQEPKQGIGDPGMNLSFSPSQTFAQDHKWGILRLESKSIAIIRNILRLEPKSIAWKFHTHSCVRFH